MAPGCARTDAARSWLLAVWCQAVEGVDGNTIQLHVTRPEGAAAEEPLPCIVYLHGGGMCYASPASPNYARVACTIASLGAVVVSVDFRNSGGQRGNHPFPAGLNDCLAALEWAHEHRAQLKVSKIVVAGDSGGGNLSLATALKAKKDGKLHLLDGVFALCPYISGMYDDPAPELPSLVENDGYFVTVAGGAIAARLYDPEQQHRTNPLAWPYHAAPEDLAGLPPHVVSLNELCPYRDEGLGYFRKLAEAGVAASARTVAGTFHAWETVVIDAVLPHLALGTFREMLGFARSL